MVDSPEDLDEICTVLDKLTLDALLLMEEEIQLKLNVENAMCGGEAHLAKARYIMGHNKVTALQLPTENGPEFSATVKVYPSDDDKMIEAKSYEVHVSDKNGEDRLVEPLRWFGVLVPQNLNLAQSMFRQALQWVVKAANVQTQLKETVNKIFELKEIKASIVNKNDNK